MLSSSDKLKSRVIMAKALIPYYQIVGEFIKEFPEWEGQEKQLKNLFGLKSADETFTKHLEQWAKQFPQKKG